MCEHEVESMDKAFRPSTAMPSRQVASNQHLRHPQEQAEIDSRVAIYIRQIEQEGRIRWLPRKGEGQSA